MNEVCPRGTDYHWVFDSRDEDVRKQKFECDPLAESKMEFLANIDVHFSINAASIREHVV